MIKYWLNGHHVSISWQVLDTSTALQSPNHRNPCRCARSLVQRLWGQNHVWYVWLIIDRNQRSIMKQLARPFVTVCGVPIGWVWVSLSASIASAAAAAATVNLTRPEADCHHLQRDLSKKSETLVVILTCTSRPISLCWNLSGITLSRPLPHINSFAVCLLPHRLHPEACPNHNRCPGLRDQRTSCESFCFWTKNKELCGRNM